MFALAILTFFGPDSGATYSGREQQLKVAVPRIEAEISVDGRLGEPAWARAARLTGFSQYSPSDGRPAEENTEVLVWYSPAAIHFGVRATSAPGTVRAHLADRDRGIIPDDYIEIQLGTFNDGRQAFIFAVNPFGVQADGALIEGNQVRQRGDGNDRGGREQADLSPDYVWESKGQVSDSGFELEIRIPFKSLRYQRADPQTWALQIIRKSAASGREDTWVPARRAASSFLSQAGTLEGLTGIRRGLVLELNPAVTSTVNGSPLTNGDWRYQGGEPQFGGNLKWGVSPDVNLNATYQPDFSQVESDAAQITPDPRNAIFFQEKRPFFLDGIEYFSTPTQTIYTRRIVAPQAAAKITGRNGGFNFGLLSAVDSRSSGLGLKNPVYNLVRIQKDIGRQSRIGLAYTDRVEGGDYNRVLEFDSRLLFGGVYSLAVNAAGSQTRVGGVTTRAPIWSINLARNGRTFGFQATARGLDPDFRALSGFINRGNLAQIQFQPSFTAYGKRGALIERFTGSMNLDWLWIYHDLFDGRASIERKYHPRTNWVLRGGWTVSLSIFYEQFAVDPGLYGDYAIALPKPAGGVDTIPYLSRPLPDLPNVDLSLNFNTPEIHGFTGNGFVIYGRDENFFEWSRATIWFGRLGLQFRPTDKLRFDGSLAFRTYDRLSDGTRVGSTWIPRLKLEYQLSRALFLRAVGEYNASRTDDLRDDGRTNAPILIRDPTTGSYSRDLALASRSNDFRVDWLFAYQPRPGTVFFAGYGSSLVEDEAFRFRGLRRLQDGFFTKLSYLFRI